MVIYGTFCGFKNYKETSNKIKWDKIVDELGKDISGVYLTEKSKLFPKNMRFGDRYRIVTNSINGIFEVKKVNKNPKCDIFRKFKDEFHMIAGKYQGKRDIDIPDFDMARYCIWLAKNTHNEATIRNTLQILQKITDNGTV